MQSIASFMGSGSIYKYPTKPAVSITIVNFSDITNKIIPLFNKYPIMGIKFYDYLDWCKVHNFMLNKMHLTPEGVNIIQKLKAGMNKGRNLTLNK